MSPSQPSDSTELNNNEPRAIQIIEAKPDHTFELNLESLKEVVQRPHVRDKRVMVLSVAGAFRKGKSFLLDFLLRQVFYNFLLYHLTPKLSLLGCLKKI